MAKLSDLRYAWVKFAHPAAAAAATAVLKEKCADLTIPDSALDLAALANIVSLESGATRSVRPMKLSRVTYMVNDVVLPCPLISMNPTSKPTSSSSDDSRLATLALSSTDIKASLPPSMTKRQQSGAVEKAHAMARFLMHHGIPDDIVSFVMGVRKLVDPETKLNWRLWLRAPDQERRPPLWWRVFMVILESGAVGGARYYLQMTRQPLDNALHFVEIMNTRDFEGQVPCLDVWTWDTAAALEIMQTYLFKREINSSARKTVSKFRNKLGHFDVDMSFSDGFECIDQLLCCLGKTDARSHLKRFYNEVRAWFPAFGESERLEQARMRPLLLTARQYDEFQKYVLDEDGHIKSPCRLRFQCGASSGKTVIAFISFHSLLL